MDIQLIIRSIESGSDDIRIFTDLDLPVSVEIKEQFKQPTTFTVTYPEDICDGNFGKIELSYFDPFSELEICVRIDGEEYCLVRGLVQGQQIKLAHGGEGSQVQVTGADNSIRFGWVTETNNWGPKIDREEIFAILSTTQVTKDKKKVSVNNYAFDEYHIMGRKFDSAGKEINAHPAGSDANGEDKEQPPPPPPEEGQDYLGFKDDMLQRNDDLAFIRNLADQKGMYFWISYEKVEGSDDVHKEIVHFERLPLWQIGKDHYRCPEAITLLINNEPNDLDEFNISWDCDRPTSVSSEYTNRKTGDNSQNTVERAEQSKLGNVPLADMSGYVIEAFQTIPVNNEKDMDERNNAALNEAEWFIKANCSTSYDRLCNNADIREGKFGRVFHAHSLINILGAGNRHSGTYLVSGVSHSINAGSYKVQLELMRNAWIDISKFEEPTAQEPVEEEVGENA